MPAPSPLPRLALALGVGWLVSCSGVWLLPEDEGQPLAAPCGPEDRDGACAGGFVCAGGACRAVCPAAGVELCQPGAECLGAECQDTACSPSNPYGGCGPGERCRDGACAAEVPCSAAAPSGACPTGEYCASGQCTPQPPCSLDFPGGACAGDTYCDEGVCLPYACSLEHPSGVCPGGVACVFGECSPTACSAAVPMGTCEGDAACVSEAAHPDFGTCQPPCSAGRTDGYCPVGQECLAGACVPACPSAVRCGPSQTCCDAGEACVADVCTETCTSTQAQCGATCCEADELCAFDTCVLDQGPCIEDAECANDSYCDCPGGAPCNPAGSCLPYGLDPDHPGFNEDCANLLVVGVFAPGHQCQWSGPTDRVAHCGVCDNAAGDAKTCRDGLCVGCSVDDDCSPGEICEAGTCHTSCGASPTACASTERCEVVAPGTRPACYECTDTTADTDCYGGLQCVRGYCVDPYVNHTRVLSTPSVVDFDFDGDPNTLQPSIVFVATDHVDGGAPDCRDSGVIRVIDGRDCRTQFVVNRRRDDRYGAAHLAPAARAGHFPDVRACNPVALADLDSSAPTRAEIVAHAATATPASPNYGGLVAFRYDPAARGGRGAFSLAWHSTDATGTAWDNACSDAGQLWSGPSVFDLDGDGSPEALYGPYTYDAGGRFLSRAGNGAVSCQPYSQGIFPVVGDVDADGVVEWVDGAHVYPWDATSGQWSTTNEQTTAANVGQVAIADFGTYGPTANDRTTMDGVAEVAIVRGGSVFIRTLSGRLIDYPDAAAADFVVSLGVGTGGPPTVADFDGDCRVEIAAASQNFFGVYDPDCDGETPDRVSCKGVDDVSTCPTFGQGYPKGVLFRVASQDDSSNVTGSSVFDFESDGRAEAVYADECFTRVYDGRSGAVIYSQYHSSCTWYENPVIADVDGDFNAEVVVPSNTNCSVSCTGSTLPASASDSRRVDAQFAGLRCESDADCVGPPGSCACKYGADSGGRCLAGADPNDVELGLCTCASDAECGPSSAYFICADRKPDAEYSFLGTRRVCRAHRPGGFNGILVYRDILDRWANTRRIWNQHAYSITHTSELGVTQPSTVNNWSSPGLNNFRQNLLTDFNPESSPDATIRPGGITCGLGESGVEGTVTVQLCNRGTADIGPLPVGFYYGDPDASGELMCRVTSTVGLAPGACTRVTCDFASLTFTCPLSRDVHVRADDVPDGIGERECLEDNNLGVLRAP